MNDHRTSLQNIKHFILSLAIVWTSLVAVSLGWALHTAYQVTLDTALVEARAAFHKDLLYRRWVAGHGGVYVPVTDRTPPNPYLDVPSREVITTDGLTLTLVNPAYMTRQVQALGAQLYGTQGRFTSLQPIYPGNAPDSWGTTALVAFERGMTEVSSVEMVNDMTLLRYMQVMITEENCLACHANQGYQVGDIRGGIEVAVPLDPYFDAQTRVQHGIIAGHSFLWLLGLGGILLSRECLLTGIRREVDTAQRLQDNEQRFRLLAENASDIIYRMNLWPKPCFEYVSPAVTKVTGYTPDEHYAEPGLICRVIYADDMQNLLAMARIAPDKPVTQRWFRRDGSVVWIEQRYTPIFDEQGNLCALHGIARDITERKLTELALMESERRLKLTLQGTRAGTWEWNVQTGETAFNDRWAEIVGYTVAELEPVSIETWRQLIHPDDLAKSNALLQRHFTGVTAFYECEARMRHKEGHWVWILDRGTVLEWTETGEPLRMFGTHVDVTERKSADDALRESEERFRAFVDQSNDGIVLINEDGCVVEWNAAQEKTTGISREKALYQPLPLVQSWSNRGGSVVDAEYQRIEETLHMALAGFHTEWLDRYIETPIWHQDGTLRVIQSVVFAIEVAGGRRMLGSILRDITDQRYMEDALRRSEERYRSVIHAMSEGVVLQSNDGSIVASNPAAKRILGLTLEHMGGRAGMDPRWSAIHEDETPFPREAHPALVTLETGLAQTNVIMGIRMPDQGLVWVSVNSQPVYYSRMADDTLPDAVVTTFVDITERKKAQRREFELALEKERRHLLTAFIQNAAHEFRTPLASISSNAYLLARTDDPERRQLKAEHTQEQVARIAKLVDMLLLMAKLESNGSLAHGPVALPMVFENVLTEITASKHGRALHCDIPEHLPLIMGDLDYLIDAFKQLLDNALRYSAIGERVIVAAGVCDDILRIEVRDHGPGIAAEHLPHIFETFWRMDDAHTTSGFGLGLPIAQKIIQRHGGRISVCSVVEEGTTVIVELPIMAAVVEGFPEIE